MAQDRLPGSVARIGARIESCREVKGNGAGTGSRQTVSIGVLVRCDSLVSLDGVMDASSVSRFAELKWGKSSLIFRAVESAALVALAFPALFRCMSRQRSNIGTFRRPQPFF